MVVMMFVHIQENRGARFGESSLVFVVHALLFSNRGCWKSV